MRTLLAAVAVSAALLVAGCGDEPATSSAPDLPAVTNGSTTPEPAAPEPATRDPYGY